MDEPWYVHCEVDGQEIGLDPKGHERGMNGSPNDWHVDDIEATLEQLVEAGATPARPITSVGGGRRIASVMDADGNVVGLRQPA